MTTYKISHLNGIRNPITVTVEFDVELVDAITTTIIGKVELPDEVNYSKLDEKSSILVLRLRGQNYVFKVEEV